MKTTDIFNKAFGRKDLQNYTTTKNNEDNIFDEVIGKFHGTDGTLQDIHYTNDPIKMLGCGYRIKSSYSPESKSFKYLPSFVLQDYIGMLYIRADGDYYIERNGVVLEAPNYAVRAFVMINPESKKILFKMPVYTDDTRLYGAFDSIPHEGFGKVLSDTVAPEIHLDVLDLLRAPNTNGSFPKRHIALCAKQYGCKESTDEYIARLDLFHKQPKKRA